LFGFAPSKRNSSIIICSQFQIASTSHIKTPTSNHRPTLPNIFKMSSSHAQKHHPFNLDRLCSINLIDFIRVQTEAKNIGAVLPPLGNLSHELLLFKILEFYNKKSILLPFHANWWKKSKQTGDYAESCPTSVADLKKEIVSFVMTFVQQNEIGKAAVNTTPKALEARRIW